MGGGGTLGGDEDSHIMAIKERLDSYGMYCEVESKGFDLARFTRMAKIAHMLHVKIIRPYAPLTDSSKKGKRWGV